MATLTDTKARHIKPDDKPIPHGGVVGLSLHPSNAKGKGKWVLRFVSPVTGKRRNAGLGTYPEVPIAEAVNRAHAMRQQITSGADPLELKKAQNTSRTEPSFEEAARQLHADLLPGWKNTKHQQQWINTLSKYVFQQIGSMRVSQITPSDVAEVLRPIWLKIPETATRVKQRMHAVMSWAWAHSYCSGNPVDVVHFLLPTQPGKSIRVEHQPSMPWQDIPQFVKNHLLTENKFDVTRALIMVIVLTACRSGEARGMRWSEIDWDKSIWTIPASRMKAKQAHRVPLTPYLREVLLSFKGLHSDLVFPGVRSRKELSDMVLTMFLRRVNANSNTDSRTATIHGFRSSFRDWASEHGFSRDLAERALAHTVANKVEAAYHRTDLLEQRREMMHKWGEFVLSGTQS